MLRVPPTNNFGREFMSALEERHKNLNNAIAILRAYPQFTKLNRSTLYRWMHIPDEEVSARAKLALDTLKNTPRISARTELVQGWILKLNELDAKLRSVRREIQEVVAQLTFHQS